MSENIYDQHFSTDNALCTPVITQEQLAAILMSTHAMADSLVGEGAKPKVIFDLEQLQVADYSNFPPITQQQEEAVRKLQASQPIRTDELTYLALRSLISFCWDEPQSNDEVLRAAAYDSALEKVLTEVSQSMAKNLARDDAPLPYWGRMGFLRVMASIPNEQIEEHRLDRFACVLVKDPVFNARSYHYGDFGLIRLNFALEPILKGLNRMLLHFFHTQDISGPRRTYRAWSCLAPIVAYFWARGAVAANRLSPSHLFFDEKVAYMVHAITASQVDFIIRHELGHLVLDHGRILRSLSGGIKELRHEFEFAADVFAQSSLRSTLYSRLRADLQWSQGSVDAAVPECKGLNTLHDHQGEQTGIRLLFIYMDAIDQAGQLLRRRLGEAIRFRSDLDSHPSPRDRLARLDTFHLGEYPPTSPLIRYAESFFSDTLKYAESLDDEALAAHLKGLY